MKKRAQEDDYSSLGSFYQPAVKSRTLEDLYLAIRADAGLPPFEKAQVINQVKSLTGYANDSTPLSALMMKGLGGTIGLLISKYFGMGVMGQMMSAVAGFGIGSVINNHLNKPPNPYPGYRSLGGM